MAESPRRIHFDEAKPALNGKKLLIVDDNATNRRILELYADAWTLRSEATESPREALAWIKDGREFDVAILDMHMPEMDGDSLALAIRDCSGIRQAI